MITESEQKRDLVELYDRYNREDMLQAYAIGGGAVLMLGIAGLTVVTTPSSGFYETIEGTLHANPDVLQKWAINVIAGGYTLFAEAGIGFIGWKRSEARKSDIALQIAEVEGRMPDETNDKRVMYTSALASTLVYGVRVRTSRWGRLIDRFTRPYWEIYFGLNSVPPEIRKDATFAVFDLTVNALSFSEWDQREVGIASLNLAKQRWENIAEGKGSNRLRSYSYVMLSEINRRLGDAPPK